MIETEDYKAVYDCDGTTVRFDFAFQITEESDLDVKRYNSVGLVEVTLILGSDYTMEQATVGTWLDGGTVITTTAYITNDRISLTRDVDSTQLLDYVENDPFPAESHEGGLDKLTIIAQQGEEILSRVMTMPKSDPVGIDNELAPLEARLGRYIQFDPVTGEPNLVAAVTGSAVTTAWSELWLLNSSSSEGMDQLTFSAFFKTLVVALDAPAFRTLINVDPSLPVGTVLMYSGIGIANVATRSVDIGDDGSDTISMPGWKVCNGNASTPDLINKFVRGEAASGNTGGEDTHVLTEAELAQHTHIQNQHRHSYTSTNTSNGYSDTLGEGDGSAGATYWVDYETPTNQNTGSNAAHENKPAYHSLIYIIRSS